MNCNEYRPYFFFFVFVFFFLLLFCVRFFGPILLINMYSLLSTHHKCTCYCLKMIGCFSRFRLL